MQSSSFNWISDSSSRKATAITVLYLVSDHIEVQVLQLRAYVKSFLNFPWHRSNYLIRTIKKEQISFPNKILHTTLWAERSFRLTVAGCRRNSSSESGTFTLIALIDLSYVTAVDTRKEKMISHQTKVKADMKIPITHAGNKS